MPTPPPPPLPPDLPAVEVHDTSFTNQPSNSEFGNFLEVPDRVSVEYKEDKKDQLSFDLPKIRTSMGKCQSSCPGIYLVKIVIHSDIKVVSRADECVWGEGGVWRAPLTLTITN